MNLSFLSKVLILLFLSSPAFAIIDTNTGLNPNGKNAYEILELERSASAGDIKSRYIELVKKLHPDRNPGVSPERIREINDAHDFLKDEEARKEYDQLLREGGKSSIKKKPKTSVSFGASKFWTSERKKEFFNLVRKNDTSFYSEIEILSLAEVLKATESSSSEVRETAEALRKLMSPKLRAGEFWGPTSDHLSEAYFGGRIFFVFHKNNLLKKRMDQAGMTDGYFGKYFTFGYNNPDFGFFSDGKRLGNASFEDLSPWEVEKSSQKRPSSFSPSEVDIMAQHFIGIDMENIRSESKKQGIDLLPEVLAHEITHAYDMDILRSWAKKNILASKKDPVFQQFAKLYNGTPYIQLAFLQMFLELRGYATSIEVLEELYGRSAQEVVDLHLKNFREEMSSNRRAGDADVLAQMGLITRPSSSDDRFGGSSRDLITKASDIPKAAMSILHAEEAIYSKMLDSLLPSKSNGSVNGSVSCKKVFE